MPWQKNYNEFIQALKRVIPKEIKLPSSELTVEGLSKVLTWDEFEKLTALIMESNNFDVTLNYRIKRKEIDVLARNSRYLIGIDCKHWKRMSRSGLTRAAQMQKMRVKLAIEQYRGLAGIPVIVTLYEGADRKLEGVPIVPINKLINFVNEIDGYIDHMDIMGP